VKPATDFNAIRLEGGLVTPELLRAVAAGKADRQTPADYDLTPDTRVIDEVRAHWDRLRRTWEQWKAKSWQQGRPPAADAADTSGGTTRDQWQLPLLRALGFHNLAANPGLEVNGRRFPIARVYHASEGVRVPIHLVGAGIPLDKRTTGVAGAATDRPHAHVQAYLNEEPRALWGLISDGLVLRLLRDTTSLARPPFIEFDLVRIFEGDDFPSFAVLWLLCHATRFTGERPSDCVLELWSQKAAKEGTRALDSLRVGVEKAIEALGDGFLSHPDNKPLADAVRDGKLDKQELFQEVLRVVYRIIFVLVAEERDALHAPTASDAARGLYRSGYALGRVRELAVGGFRGTAHGDLWRAASIVFERLAEGGAPELGVNALGSFLFSPSSTPHLVGAGTFSDPTATARHDLAEHRVELRNRDFLAAMRALSVVIDPATKKERAVDFRALGAEELGSVYEGLLELHLDSASWPARFRLATSAGNERKTSGSYYTPDSLVQCLLDSALEPVIKEAAKGKKGADAAEAILNLKVCDPAVGSGHFLIAAAHRLAKHVARARAGDSEPTPDEHRTALREVIRRSVYGIDINPMSAELCRVALWMESMEPGKPLSFLESHIVVGNSLIGATPRLMAEGIPDDAFEVLEGDEKAVVSALKKRNKQERKDTKAGQGTFDFGAGDATGSDLGADFATLATASDTSAVDVAKLARRHRELLESDRYAAERLKADAWCAAFFWKKDSSATGAQAITEATFRSIEKSPQKYPIGHPIRAEIERLRGEHGFLHLHLAFPDVFRIPTSDAPPTNEHRGWNGGFDCILGNPPWDRVAIEEVQYFASIDTEIAAAQTTVRRQQLIAQLEVSRPDIAVAFRAKRYAADRVGGFFVNSGSYPDSAAGRLDLYALFVECVMSMVKASGRIGLVVPTGVATAVPLGRLWRSVFHAARLISLADFDNTAGYFRGVDSRKKFCLLTVSGSPRPDHSSRFGFFLPSADSTSITEHCFPLSIDDLEKVNPETGQPPIVPSTIDLGLLVWVHRRSSRNADITPGWVGYTSAGTGGSWRECAAAEFDRSAFAPLVEGKLILQFNHRFATYEECTAQATAKGQPREFGVELQPSKMIRTRFAVPREPMQDFLSRKRVFAHAVGCYRDYTSATNERTLIATLIPDGVPMQPLNGFSAPTAAHALQAVCRLNSFAIDYVARLKTPDIHLNVTIFNQLPGEAIGSERFVSFVLPRGCELIVTADDMSPFSKDLWPEGDGAVFRYDPERRFEIRCELDAAFFHLYLGTPEEWSRTASPELLKALPTPRDAVAYIMETFPIVKRKDEEAHGSYRTKERILALYDELQRCLASGQPFKSTLNPPPGPPTNPDGTFAKLPAWPKGAARPAGWPEHIHPPVSHRS
jgi:hypothetical protein